MYYDFHHGLNTSALHVYESLKLQKGAA